MVEANGLTRLAIVDAHRDASPNADQELLELAMRVLAAHLLARNVHHDKTTTRHERQRGAILRGDEEAAGLADLGKLEDAHTADAHQFFLAAISIGDFQ